MIQRPSKSNKGSKNGIKMSLKVKEKENWEDKRKIARQEIF